MNQQTNIITIQQNLQKLYSNKITPKQLQKLTKPINSPAKLQKINQNPWENLNPKADCPFDEAMAIQDNFPEPTSISHRQLRPKKVSKRNIIDVHQFKQDDQSEKAQFQKYLVSDFYKNNETKPPRFPFSKNTQQIDQNENLNCYNIIQNRKKNNTSYSKQQQSLSQQDIDPQADQNQQTKQLQQQQSKPNTYLNQILSRYKQLPDVIGNQEQFGLDPLHIQKLNSQSKSKIDSILEIKQRKAKRPRVQSAKPQKTHLVEKNQTVGQQNNKSNNNMDQVLQVQQMVCKANKQSGKQQFSTEYDNNKQKSISYNEQKISKNQNSKIQQQEQVSIVVNNMQSYNFIKQQQHQEQKKIEISKTEEASYYEETKIDNDNISNKPFSTYKQKLPPRQKVVNPNSERNETNKYKPPRQKKKEPITKDLAETNNNKQNELDDCVGFFQVDEDEIHEFDKFEIDDYLNGQNQEEDNNQDQ